jgi:hypothetical protein
VLGVGGGACTTLASWGYTVLLWDLSDLLIDTLTCAYMKQVRGRSNQDVCLPADLSHVMCWWLGGCYVMCTAWS